MLAKEHAVKILVAADGSACARRIVDYLARSDGPFGANHEYELLHVVEPLPHAAAAHEPVASVHHLYDEDGRVVRRESEGLFDRAGIRVKSGWVLGRPAAALARHADEGHCDLLVLGSHGRGQLGNFVLGSVAAEVLASCRTPVLVVR